MDRQQKRARLDLGTNVAATSAAHGPLLAPGFSDLIQPGCNPLNGKPYSRRYHDILKGRKELPVYGFLERLLDAVKHNQTVVVEGETGSGKTTQIPQFLVKDYGLVTVWVCLLSTQINVGHTELMYVTTQWIHIVL